MTTDRGGPGRERLRYLSAAQHEVNTPLAVIRGWADTFVTMWDDLSDENRIRGAEAIRRYVGDLATLLDAVFVEARLDAHSRRGERGPVELAAAVADAVGVARRAVGEGLEDVAPVQLAIDQDVMVALVMAITDGLSQDEAQVVVSVREPEDRSVTLVFRGSEAGVSGDPFDPFPDGDPSPVGIRLSAARNLARALGGELAILEGNEGLTLLLRLPRV